MVQQCDFCDVLPKSNLCSCIFRLVFIFLESQNLAVSLDTPSGPITPIHASICIWQLWKFFIADLFVTESCIYTSQRWRRKMKIFVNTFNKANPIYMWDIQWEVVHKLLLPQKSLGSSSSQTTFHLLQKLKKQMYDWEGGSITSQTNHTIHSVEVCHFLASLKKRPMKITSLQQLFSAIIFPPMTHCYRVQYVQTHDLSKVETRPHGRFIKSYFGAASKDVVLVLWILSAAEKRGIFRPLLCSGL